MLSCELWVFGSQICGAPPDPSQGKSENTKIPNKSAFFGQTFDDFFLLHKFLNLGFCKHTSVVCFIRVCLFCRRVVSFLAVSASLLAFVNSMGWHDLYLFVNFPPESHLKFRFFNQTWTWNFTAPSTEAESPSPRGNTMNSSILVPWIRLGDDSESRFLPWPWLWFSPKCWHRTRQKPPTHRTKTQLFLFWRNEKPPHWDGICDNISCPVHTSVLADQTEFLFSSSKVSDWRWHDLTTSPSAIYYSETGCSMP